MPDKSRTARIEVFRPGTFQPMQGEAITYSAADLKAVADVYDAQTAPAPIVVGHPSTDAPAFGWVEGFEFDATAERLYAHVGQIEPAFADAVRAGRYKKVSLSFHPPEGAANPVPGCWYPKHVGFLGGAAPAVAGLKNVQFSDDANAPTFTADFAEPGFQEAATLLRSLREFFIEKFGLEDADKALPAFRIEWLDNMEIEKPAARTAFSAPPIHENRKQEPPVSKPNPVTPDPAFAARETDLANREAALKRREAEITHNDNVAFAEALVSEGKLIPAASDQVVAILDALPGEAAVSFAEGEAAVPVTKALRDLLSAQPKVVSFGSAAIPEEEDAAPVSFASDGIAVDQDQLGVHQKALNYQKQHPGTAYLDAVRAVS